MPFSEAKHERAGVYLTNSLTGWEPPKGPKLKLPFPELEEERDSAEVVKREKPILVVLGNPPYNAFAGVSPAEEQGLVEPYKEGLISHWGIKKFNLDDLYVRFFRVAERRIAEQTGIGIVCFISNFSYLGDPSFVAMRERFLSEFDYIWVDSLNGDSRETGKLTPEGEPDPSIFSTQHNKEGIRVGTAIALMARKAEREPRSAVRFRNFWGTTKREDLLDALKNPDLDAGYLVANPASSNRYSFRPSGVAIQYLAWPKLTELAAHAPLNGMMEKRHGALIDIDRQALEARMKMYYDDSVDWEILRNLGSGLTEPAAGYDPAPVRDKVRAAEAFDGGRIRPYDIRPFERRWCYYSSVSPLWNRSRPSLSVQAWEANEFLLSRFSAAKDLEGSPFYISIGLFDDHLLAPDAVAFSIRVRAPELPVPKGQSSFLEVAEPARTVTANLSLKARAYLAELEFGDPDADEGVARLIWMHSLAVGYSPAYLGENSDGVRQDWPRIPLPSSKDLLEASARLGTELAALLRSGSEVAGVSAGEVRAELREIGRISSIDGKSLKPDTGDLALTAGWGYLTGGTVMPGGGKVVEREYSSSERLAIEQGAAFLGLDASAAFSALGDTTLDVHLNGRAFWSNVPRRAWTYTIGGYQVAKKWLSYREHDVIGRTLLPEETREFTQIVRRVSAVLLLEPTLDANYALMKASQFEWPRTGEFEAGQ